MGARKHNTAEARKAAKKQVAIAKYNDTYFFERDEHTHTSVPRSLEILKDGRIVNPPKGFFDQIDIDMRLIMGF